MASPKQIGAYLLLGILWCACENDPAEVQALTRKVQEVEEGKDISATISESGLIRARLYAPVMLRVKADSQYAEFPNTIYIDFYKDSITRESTLKAKYARYYENLGKAFLRDSVVVYSTAGDTLYAKTLWWDQYKQEFTSDDSVYINSPTQTMRGTGLWALSNLDKWIIRNSVGQLPIPDSVKPQ
jgi:LPS export ABC transporter protein LptC